MKMGNTRSPWRYDAGACNALQSVILRRATKLRYASHAAVFPVSQGLSYGRGLNIVGVRASCSSARSAR
jgi:hypothetical protein